MSAWGDIQTALYTVLTPAVTAVGTRIYGRAPNTPVYPYITIRSMMATPKHDHDDRYEVHIFVFDVWSRPSPQGAAASQKQAYDIMGQIRAAIDRKTLALPSGSAYKHISTLERETLVLDEGDGLTFHGVYQTEIIVAPIA
jgi:hypothetical protein